MTTRGTLVLFGALAAAGVGRLLGISELYVLAGAAGLLVLFALLAVRLVASSVGVHRDVSAARLLPGQKAEVHLRLRGLTRLPAPMLMLTDACDETLARTPRFVVTGLRDGAQTELSYTIVGSRRGRRRVGPLTVRVRDPFGLAERTRRFRAAEEVVVFPPVEVLDAGTARGAHGSSGANEMRRLWSRGDEFHSMREYVRGDDLRHVHWPSTARRQQLMLRQLELPRQASATIMLDTRADAHVGKDATSTFEKGVAVAASVLWHLAGRGYDVRLVTAGGGAGHGAAGTPQAPGARGTTMTAGPRAGAPGWEVLLEGLAVAAPERGASLVAALGSVQATGDEGLLVAVLAPPLDDAVAEMPETAALFAAGRRFSSRIAVVVHDQGRRITAERAEVLARMLATRGWRTTTLDVHDALAPEWSALGRPRSARAS